MIKKGSSFIVLYTDSVKKTSDFYKNIGAEIKTLEETKCVVQIGDHELHYCVDEPVKEYQHLFKQTHGGGVLFYLEVENVDKMFETIRNTGTKIQSQIEDRPWETKEFLCEDPNGYNLIFYQNI